MITHNKKDISMQRNEHAHHRNSLFPAIKRWVKSKSHTVVVKNPNCIPHEDNIDILFIHGTADREACFKEMTKKLKPKLPSNISSMHRLSFHHRFQGTSIEDFVNQVLDYAVANKLKHIVIVGHSRGGLVAHYAKILAKKRGLDISVDASVAICAPFLGAKSASSPLQLFSTSVREMKENSSFLQKLNKELDAFDNEAFYYIGARHDKLVTADSACRGHIPDTNCAVFDGDHLYQPISDACIDHVNGILHNISKQPIQQISYAGSKAELNT